MTARDDQPANRPAADRLRDAARALKDAKAKARLAIEKQSDVPRSARIVVEVVRFLQTWDKNHLGEWSDAIAVMAWRQRWRFDPGPKESDLGALRVLVRLLSNESPNRCSQFANLANRLRRKTPDSIPKIIIKAGGIDHVSFRGGELPKQKVLIRYKRDAARKRTSLKA